jgi:hypothetical protein
MRHLLGAMSGLPATKDFAEILGFLVIVIEFLAAAGLRRVGCSTFRAPSRSVALPPSSRGAEALRGFRL